MGTNDVGDGKVVLLHGVEFDGLNQTSDQVVLLSNILESLSGLHGGSPFWYGSETSNQTSSVVYAISGDPGGPVLIWVSNPGDAAANFTLYLNATYYGFGSWRELDLANLGSTSGNDSTIRVSLNLQPQSWAPVFVFEDQPHLAIWSPPE